MKYEKADKTTQTRSRRLRLSLLAGILVLMTAAGIAHQVWGARLIAGVDALCPFGGIEALYTLLISGAIMQRVAVSSFILLAAVLLSALLFRRSFCGLICPLGTLQELAGMLGAALFKKRYNPPTAVDRWSRYIKYAVLLVIIVFSAMLGELVIRPYDPWVAYQHLASAELLQEFAVGLAVLVITLMISLVSDRPFCRYLCPMGAILGIVSPAGRFKVTRNTETCIDCKICSRQCPMGIDVAVQDAVRSAECIQCSTCVNVCPVKDALIVRTSKGRTAAPNMILLTVAAIFLLTVGVTTATGDFQWNQKTLQQETEEKGAFDTASIKGWMTFKDVSEASGIPEEVFKEKYNLKEGDLARPIKEVGPEHGFETDAVREFVDMYQAAGE